MAMFSTLAMAGAAVAGGVAAGAIAKSGAEAGGDMAYSAANQAAQQNLQEAQKARSAASPWTSSGTSAVGKITNLLGLGTLTQQGNNQGIYWVDPTDAKGAQQRAMADFQTDPGYQFRMDEGTKALDRSAASRGLLRSGAQAKAITDFGQNIASAEYGNYFDRLLKVSGMGSESSASASNTAAGLTQGAGNMLTQGGIARGSAYADGAKSMASGISSGVNNAIGGAYLMRGAK